jgi:hypothetical protein
MPSPEGKVWIVAPPALAALDGGKTTGAVNHPFNRGKPSARALVHSPNAPTRNWNQPAFGHAHARQRCGIRLCAIRPRVMSHKHGTRQGVLVCRSCPVDPSPISCRELIWTGLDGVNSHTANARIPRHADAAEWGVALPLRRVEIEGWPGELKPDQITRRAASAKRQATAARNRHPPSPPHPGTRCRPRRSA